MVLLWMAIGALAVVVAALWTATREINMQHREMMRQMATALDEQSDRIAFLEMDRR